MALVHGPEVGDLCFGGFLAGKRHYLTYTLKVSIWLLFGQ